VDEYSPPASKAEDVRLRRVIAIGKELEGKEALVKSGREVGHLRYQEGVAAPCGDVTTRVVAPPDETGVGESSKTGMVGDKAEKEGGRDELNEVDGGSEFLEDTGGAGLALQHDVAADVPNKALGSVVESAMGLGSTPTGDAMPAMNEIRLLMEEAEDVRRRRESEDPGVDLGLGLGMGVFDDRDEGEDANVGLRLPGGNVLGDVGDVGAGDVRDLETAVGRVARKRRAVDPPTAGAPAIGGREKRARKLNREVADWIQATNGYLRMGVDDPAWIQLVDAWYQWEQQALDTTSRLTELSLRPIELTKWIGSRKYDADPLIADTRDYAQRWLTWWLAMQPACRRVEGRGLPLPLEEWMRVDISSLRKAGVNGMSVLLVGLRWWAPLRRLDERWGMVVDDIRRCVEGFIV
jgi:hypothetical protein